MEKDKNTSIKTVNLSVMSRKELEDFAMKTSIENEELTAKIAFYQEQLRQNRARKFGPSSEVVHQGQLSFFNEAEAEGYGILPEPSKEEVLGPPAKKKKQKGHKKRVTRNLPRQEIHHVLSPQEQACPTCGGELCEMKTQVRTEIKWIPAKAIAVDHVQHVYTCRNCDRNGTEGTIIAASAPGGVFRNSLASPSLLSDIAHKKYVLAQPLNRQAEELKRAGLLLSRNTLANWMIKATDAYLVHLYDHMKSKLLTQRILHSDDTQVEVLKEPDRKATAKSYMWLYRSGSDTDQPTVLYEYTQGRGARFPVQFLQGFTGYLQVDGYAGYHKLVEPKGPGPPEVILTGCWAHARRGFTDVMKGLSPEAKLTGSVTEEALNYIRTLFDIERRIQEYSIPARFAYRNAHAGPVVDAFFVWLKQKQDSCGGSLRQAVNYCLNQEVYLRNYLLDGALEFTNNRAERSIKPFVLGRKNWLFCDTPGGARASAILYSIIETAKENGLDDRAYLEHIFETFKDADLSSLNMEDYMPWSASLPTSCLPMAIPSTST